MINDKTWLLSLNTSVKISRYNQPQSLKRENGHYIWTTRKNISSRVCCWKVTLFEMKKVFFCQTPCKKVVSIGHSGALFGPFLHTGVCSVCTSPFHIFHHWVSLLLYICARAEKNWIMLQNDHCRLLKW